MFSYLDVWMFGCLEFSSPDAADVVLVLSDLFTGSMFD